MARFLSLLNRVIDLGLVFVLVFTPLAFGAVEEWSQAIAQSLIILITGSWLSKLAWSSGSWRAVARGRSILGGRVQLSGLEIPAFVFAVIVLVQLIPLPPSVLKTISPRTAEIYTESLPGYGVSENPTFRDLPRWLQDEPEPRAGDVPALPPDPDAASRALPPEVFDLPHPAWRPLSLTPAHTRRALAFFLAHLALFVVVFNHLAEPVRAVRFLFLLAGMVGILSVVGIAQDLGGGGNLYGWRTSGAIRPFGPFVNANNFAGWMEMALPVCAGLAAMVWERQRRGMDLAAGSRERASRNLAISLLLVFFTVIGVAAFLTSRSRGGFFSFSLAVMIPIVIYLGSGRLRWKVVGVLVVIAAVGMCMAAWLDWPGLWNRVGSLERPTQDPSLQARLGFSERALQMSADFPALGTGLGTFAEAHFLYSPGTSHTNLRRAHNDYAQVMSECGLAGTLVVVWALVVLIARGLVPGLLSAGGPLRWPVRGAAIGILALLVHSFVDFNLQIYSNSVLFVFLCAFLLRHGKGTPGEAGG